MQVNLDLIANVMFPDCLAFHCNPGASRYIADVLIFCCRRYQLNDTDCRLIESEQFAPCSTGHKRQATQPQANALTERFIPFTLRYKAFANLLVTDIDRALSEIADIRARLVASTRFRGIAPEANVLVSTLSLAVAAAQTMWPDALAADAFHYITVWAAVLVASAAIATVEAMSRARRLHGPMADAMLGMALREVLPFVVAEVVITVVICRLSPANVWILPGLWLLLIGLLGFSVLRSLPRAIGWVAGWYFMCGVVVLVLSGESGALTPWMMGIPLGVGQASVALVLYRANGERDGQA